MIYSKIKELCKVKGISVYFLEKELGLSTGSISKWKKSIPAVDKLQKIANYFNVRINYFLEN